MGLSEPHYEDVVHPYLRTQEMSEDGFETLLIKAVGTSTRSETFAMSFQDFIQILTEEEKKNKEQMELQVDYATNLDKFREFLTGPLLTVVTLDLPTDIRLLFLHAMLAVNNRQFAKKEPHDVDAAVLP